MSADASSKTTPTESAEVAAPVTPMPVPTRVSSTTVNNVVNNVASPKIRPIQQPAPVSPERVSVTTEKEEPEEPVDWLAKFREAAKRFEDEKTPSQTVAVETDDSIFVSEQPKKMPEKPKVQLFYYRSRLGGLKDIAQTIDKSAKNSGLSYAFTLAAGLSLFKPIKPFSILHAYIKSKDLDFFERSLMLIPSEESNAQLCLLTSDDAYIYNASTEMHGLIVVSKEQLMSDVRKYADEALSQEAASILK
jgi:hypothetical protein